jgi:decaprenylphospho-beta-D-erythro-pentofuranosid-2-ulose 2-reductase
MRKIVIFGANSAVAQACARLWAEEGHEMFLVSRNSKKLAALVDDLRVRSRAKIQSKALDLSDIEEHKGLFQEIRQLMGSFDTLFVAHGILGSQKEAESDFDKAREMFDTNLMSPMALLTVGAQELEKQGRGQIAVITSVAGDRGRQSNYFYGASKGALSIFLSGLRNKLALKGVSVTDIKLGFVDSPMTQEFKKGLLWKKPEQVAHKIVRSIDKGRDVVYTPGFWRPIMLIIRLIPEKIFKKLKL